MQNILSGLLQIQTLSSQIAHGEVFSDIAIKSIAAKYPPLWEINWKRYQRRRVKFKLTLVVASVNVKQVKNVTFHNAIWQISMTKQAKSSIQKLPKNLVASFIEKIHRLSLGKFGKKKKSASGKVSPASEDLKGVYAFSVNA